MSTIPCKMLILSFSACVGSVFANWTLNSKPVVHAAKNCKLLESEPGVIPTRVEQVNRLKCTKEFDVLIIGGGITGAGCALDAASRGLKTAMIDASDFASGTSSKSTKLIHGGVRYLQSAIMGFDSEQYNMVKEALRERTGLLECAPHLAYPIPIMLPVYRWWQVPYFWMGLKMYDLVAGSKNIKSSYYLPKKETLEQFPMLKNEELCGSIVYYDGQMDDARMSLSVALTAAKHGAAICNYVVVKNLLKRQCACGNKVVSGVKVIDRVTGKKFKIRAKCVINATGPYCDEIRKMADPNATSICTPSSGAHIILPNFYSSPKMGLLDPNTSDGRIIFLLPWQGHTIAGTTDRSCEITRHPNATEAEIEFILEEIKNYFNGDLVVRRSDVLSAWSGIRPLVSDPSKKDTKTLARNHIIEVSSSKLITIAGGKWTTYRSMAEQTIDTAIDTTDLDPKVAQSPTASIKLHGSNGWTPTMHIRLVQDFGLEYEIAQHLSNAYGEKAFEVAKMAKETADRWPAIGLKLHPDFPIITAEVRYAVKEYACTIVDVIARRLRLAFLNTAVAEQTLYDIADIMGEELKWSDKDKDKQVAKARKFLRSEMGHHEFMMNQDKENKTVNLTNEDIAKYTGLFQEMDKNNKGYVTINDIRETLSLFNEDSQINDEKLRTILEEIDKNMNGQVELNDYLQVMSAIKSGDPSKIQLPRLEAMKKQRKEIERLRHPISIERSGGGV